ncbi:MAG: 3-hydroxyacyl-CoA dehydrogenase [Acidobacteria bacterium]|nr:3-hydroxyacyl-CoA dehydrogenase [Acidobacteriota bacterium]
MSVETIAVIGAGTMGRGIAQVSAMAGFRTWMYDVADSILEKARAEIAKNLNKGKELGKISPEAFQAAQEKLASTTDFDEAVGNCDFLIEAAPEDIKLKLEIFHRANQASRPGAILASNTSSLSVTEIAAAVADPRRVIGMHFFNPVHLMKLIEIIRGLETSAETYEATVAVARRMGRETVNVKESPGFVTSRINAMIGNEAFYLLQEGIASARDIDKALKLGLNHPMGPFEMIDLVGLDTRLSILEFLHARLGEKYRPCPLLVQYVKAGRLGKKVGKGVYEYPS